MNHAYDGTREIDCANYTGTVFSCTCGERRENMGELEEHMAAENTREALTVGITDLRRELE